MPEQDATGDPKGYDPTGSTVTWKTFLDEAVHRLSRAGFDNAEVDARRIVEEASGFSGAELHLGLREPATKRGVVAFDRMVERRLTGEPLQYVLGRWSFRSLDLLVDRRALIPRPETEVVAGVALEELERQAGPGQLLAADLGTGTGAIGLSIVAERVDTRAVLTDASADALALARANLTGLGRPATRVTIVHGSWFDPLSPDLSGALHLIVSNPPYVSPSDELPGEVAKWEPAEALVAPDHGCAHLDHLITNAGPWLCRGGALVLEMAPQQTAWAAGRAEEVGFTEVQVFQDLAGRKRGVRARWLP